MKQLIYLIFMGLALICQACEFSHNNYGYPSSVFFKKEGGEVMITGEAGMTGIVIYEEDKTISSSYDIETDSCWVQNSWLTIKWKFMTPGLTLIATPNSSKKNRKIWLEGYYGPEYAVINVSQKH